MRTLVRRIFSIRPRIFRAQKALFLLIHIFVIIRHRSTRCKLFLLIVLKISLRIKSCIIRRRCGLAADSTSYIATDKDLLLKSRAVPCWEKGNSPNLNFAPECDITHCLTNSKHPHIGAKKERSKMRFRPRIRPGPQTQDGFADRLVG